jgi:uncharacterized protein HemY
VAARAAAAVVVAVVVVVVVVVVVAAAVVVGHMLAGRHPHDLQQAPAPIIPTHTVSAAAPPEQE